MVRDGSGQMEKQEMELEMEIGNRNGNKQKITGTNTYNDWFYESHGLPLLLYCAL